MGCKELKSLIGNLQQIQIRRLNLNLLDDINTKNFLISLDKLTGRIIISSEPKGATIIVGEKEVGKTPFAYEMKAGIYDIRLVKKGYQIISEKIEINRT